MDFKQLIFVVVFYTCVGTLVSLGAVKPISVGRRYFVYHGLGIVALLLGCLCLLKSQIAAPGTFVALLVATTLYSFTAGRAGVAWLLYFIAVGLGAYLVLAGTPYGFNAVLSTLLIGFTMGAMLLGHWYLVEPRMAIEELRRVSLCLIALVAVRFAYGTYFVTRLALGKSELEAYRFFLSGDPGVFVLMRWFWGLLGPLALCYMIWGTVKIRSTQSATGILYVAVLFVLTGEILSQYLTLNHGMPF